MNVQLKNECAVCQHARKEHLFKEPRTIVATVTPSDGNQASKIQFVVLPPFLDKRACGCNNKGLTPICSQAQHARWVMRVYVILHLPNRT